MESEEPDRALASRRGILVPVANPEGVAPLLSIALCAADAADPAPRVLALVPRSFGYGSIGLDAGASVQEVRSEGAPSSAAIAAAQAYAQARGVCVEASAVWSGDPAHDIISAALNAGVEWIVMGYHRGLAGGDTMGGVVRQVLARAENLPIRVAVFVQGTDRPFERVFAAFDSGADGQAALSLAVRISRVTHAKLRALLVSGRVEDTGDDLLDMVHDARHKLGAHFHSDVLTKRSLGQLFKQTPGRLLIVGRKFADEVEMPLDEVPGADRCVIVVQGGAPS